MQMASSRPGGTLLYKIRSVFPFDFFPDELIIDRHKVSLIRRPFFLSERVISLSYDDISNVSMERGIFFASLEISHKIFGMPPLVIRYLKREESDKVKQLILGLAIARKEGNKEIFTSPTKELIKQAMDLGRARVLS